VASSIWLRYRRIGIPYLAALAVAILANALARQWMDHEAISASPTFGQLLAHAAFLHDILGYQALTAGIWYLAIDFQLFLLSLGLFWAAQSWLGRRGQGTNSDALRLLMKCVAPLAVASLFWFNRHSKYDAWAIYFVGSYFLGVVLHELLERRLRLSWAVSYWGLVIVAGIVDPRPRLLVAAATTLIVYLAARSGILSQWPRNSVVNYFGRISYSLFLIHFPVLLVINAWGAQRLTTSTSMAVCGLLLAYALSLMAGIVLYHGVEKRIR
jgi:peptidoglycan/LPS O-acetylase OafA/YrhL